MKKASLTYGEFFNRILHHYHVYAPETWRRKLAHYGLEVVDHRYDFSAQAHRAFDLCHYLSIPNLIARLLVGRWVLHPIQTRPFAQWLRGYYEEPLPKLGAYQFVRCERMGGVPKIHT